MVSVVTNPGAPPRGTNLMSPHKKRTLLGWGSLSSQRWRSLVEGVVGLHHHRPHSSRAGTAAASSLIRIFVAAAVAMAVTTLLIVQIRSLTTSHPSSRLGAALPEGRRMVVYYESREEGNARKVNVVEKEGASQLRSVGSNKADPSLFNSPKEPPSCPYASLQDLTNDERHPRANSTSRPHIVDPPTVSMDGAAPPTTTLVCCHTTKGPLNIAAHHHWAPNGAQRFLDMVKSQYFSTPIESLRADHLAVPLMRCVDEFLCQFGLRGDDSVQYATKILDDPQWLPSGKEGRSNALGVKRFQKGYMAYAGSGPNSRGRQLFVSLADQSGLGSGLKTPWEVPWGEVVGRHSFETLNKLYTGYGEDGPSQELLMTDAGLADARAQFPKLDWITSCHVVDQDPTPDPPRVPNGVVTSS